MLCNEFNRSQRRREANLGAVVKVVECGGYRCSADGMLGGHVLFNPHLSVVPLPRHAVLLALPQHELLVDQRGQRAGAQRARGAAQREGNALALGAGIQG